MDPIIATYHLTKQYHKTKPSLSLRESLARGFRSRTDETFLALDDLSFEVAAGTVTGIIGKNGSGKSTLLRLLSGITKPTAGRIELFGAVTSVLDIGTGFHPDLSGRENIFLRGQLFGLSAREIRARFDEMVAFSGIESFIDTPVKYYSDGMFLRLAFSLMVHLSADIILLDEVLGVGDFAFQQQCYAKIQEIARSGATVVCVSHNPGELLEICTTYLHLEQGRLVEYGPKPEILMQYLQENTLDTTALSGEEAALAKTWPNEDAAPGNESFRFKSLSLQPKGTQDAEMLFTDQDLVLEFSFYKNTAAEHLDIAFTVSDIFRHEIMACSSHRVHQYFETTAMGIYHAQCVIPGNWLNQGHFHINLFALRNREEVVFTWRQALAFTLAFREDFSHTASGLVQAPTPLAPALDWKLHFEPAT